MIEMVNVEYYKVVVGYVVIEDIKYGYCIEVMVGLK